MSDQEDLGFSLLPADDDPITPEADLDAAAAAALADPALAPVADDAPEPLGLSWAFDFTAGRFVRQGTSPARLGGLDALRMWCMTALNSARYAHAIFSPEFGIEKPQGPIGEAGDRARDAADDWRVAARDALLVHDRVADVELTVEYDPVAGQVLVTDLLVVTDEEVELPFDDIAITVED
jgi:hypothetical protein